jgi:dihydrolipoamide dehydrogenase
VASKVFEGGRRQPMGIGFLFKQNKVDYTKGTASFRFLCVIEHHSAQLNEGGEYSRSEEGHPSHHPGSKVPPFPCRAIEIDEEQIVISTRALSLRNAPGKMVFIGGSITGLEMGDV